MAQEMVVHSNNNSMLAPASLDQAMKLAEMMANAKLVPVHLQGKSADCLLVIEQAARWRMSPFAVAQSTSVIHGKLMYEGKLVAAVVNANGNLSERLSYEYEGEGDSRAIIVSGKIQGEKEPRSVKVFLKDARTTNEWWKKQPDQQLMYSGARSWARRHAPELMLGVYSPEEMEPPVSDEAMKNVTPAAVQEIFDSAKDRGIDLELEELKQKATDAALQGNAALSKFLKELSKPDKGKLVPFGTEFRSIAKDVEAKNPEAFAEELPPNMQSV